MNLLVKWGRACLGFFEILLATLFFFYKLRFIGLDLLWNEDVPQFNFSKEVLDYPHCYKEEMWRRRREEEIWRIKNAEKKNYVVQ